MESMLFLPGEHNDIVYDVGTWYLIVGILALIAAPFSFISMFPMTAAPIRTETISYVIGTLVMGALIGVIASIVEIIALLKTRRLQEVSGEELFSTGPILILIGIVLNVIGTIIIFFAIFTSAAIGPEALFSTVVSMAFFSIIAGLLAFIGRILLAIAFWRFGDLNRSDLIQVGALIWIFLAFIGYLLLGYAMRSMANNGRSFLVNETLIETIKKRLKEEFPDGASIDVRDLAKQYNVPPYLLLAMVNHWIVTGELEGTLMKYTYIVRRSSA
ncbi:MAG: DUF973 family protein [Candidatus Njordarchaeales archaeon]